MTENQKEPVEILKTKDSSNMVIGIVGPCSSGKTSLVIGLNKIGIQAHHIAQEHSYVPDMWKRISNPDILIYLDVSYRVSQERRRLDWTEAQFDDQVKRLKHANEHASLVIDSDPLSIPEILEKAIEFLNSSTNIR